VSKATNTLMKCLPPETRQELVELSTRSGIPALMSVCELIHWAHERMKELDRAGTPNE
jgi:hypothetical protein